MQKRLTLLAMAAVLMMATIIGGCGDDTSKPVAMTTTTENPTLIGYYQAAPRVFPAATSTSIDTDRIVVAVNEDFAQRHPEWKERFQARLEEVNQAFAKTTLKRFEVDQYKTYPKENMYGLATNPDYFPENAERRSICIFLYGSSNLEIPKIKWVNDISDARGKHVSVNTNRGRYQSVWLFEAEGFSAFQNLSVGDNSAPWFIEQYIEYVLREASLTLAHEFGHALALAAFGEWYLYSFPDNSLAEPHLPFFNLADITTDPMANSSQVLNGVPMEFSELNSFIINRNLGRQYEAYEIAKMSSQRVIVKVVDGDGLPIVGASVKVFGSQRGVDLGYEWNAPLLETRTTNQHGDAEIEGVGYISSAFWNVDGKIVASAEKNLEWIAKTVKVEYDSKHAGRVFTLIDLQRTFLMEGNNIHLLRIVLI